MRHRFVALIVAGLLVLSAAPTAAAAECEFVLGFATLKTLIKLSEGQDKVGDCLENERFDPMRGEALQQTTGGLLVWHQADNWTAFTDGYRTWIIGPDGLQSRLNTEQLDWERLAQLRRNAETFAYTIGQPGGTLTYSTISEPLTFNLALANDSGSSGYLSYLFEGLTEISWLTNQVEPSLAESWERSEDGLTWTFHLRQDVQWHDGQPFTAHDVDFTFNRITYNDDIASTDPFDVQLPVPGRGERPMARSADDRHGARRLHGPICAAGALCSLPPLDGHRDLSAAHPRAARG